LISIELNNSLAAAFSPGLLPPTSPAANGKLTPPTAPIVHDESQVEEEARQAPQAQEKKDEG
jgi:hypothetical protein